MMKKHNALIPDSPCEVQLIKLPGTSFHQDLYWDVHVCPSCLALVFSLSQFKVHQCSPQAKYTPQTL